MADQPGRLLSAARPSCRLASLTLRTYDKSFGPFIPTLFDSRKTTGNYSRHEGYSPLGSDNSRSRDSDFSGSLFRGYRLEHRIFGRSLELQRHAQQFVPLGPYKDNRPLSRKNDRPDPRGLSPGNTSKKCPAVCPAAVHPHHRQRQNATPALTGR